MQSYTDSSNTCDKRSTARMIVMMLVTGVTAVATDAPGRTKSMQLGIDSFVMTLEIGADTNP